MDRRHFVTAAGLLFAAGCTGAGETQSTESSTTQSAKTSDQPDQTTTGTDEQTTEEPAEPPEMSTVFHLQTYGAEHERKALNNVENLRNDETVPVEDVVLVANSKAVNSLTSEGAEYPDRIKQLQTEMDVTFCACQNSMEAVGIAKGELLDDVKIVPSGVGEFTRLQTKGYAYIKVA